MQQLCHFDMIIMNWTVDGYNSHSSGFQNITIIFSETLMKKELPAPTLLLYIIK